MLVYAGYFWSYSWCTAQSVVCWSSSLRRWDSNKLRLRYERWNLSEGESRCDIRRYSSGCAALWSFAEPPSAGRDDSSSPLRWEQPEKDLRPGPTWHLTVYTISAPSFFFLSLASTYMRDALFWDFPDFLSPVSVGCCCYGKERESVFPWSSPSCTSSSSCTLSNQIQNITTCMKVRRGLASAYITGLLSPLSSFRRLRSSIQAVITESHLRPGSECPAVSGWSCKKCFCSCVERFLFFCALCCKLSYRQETAQERWFWSFGYKEIFQNHSIHRIKHFVYGRPKLKTHN